MHWVTPGFSALLCNTSVTYLEMLPHRQVSCKNFGMFACARWSPLVTKNGCKLLHNSNAKLLIVLLTLSIVKKSYVQLTTIAIVLSVVDCHKTIDMIISAVTVKLCTVILICTEKCLHSETCKSSLIELALKAKDIRIIPRKILRVVWQFLKQWRFCWLKVLIAYYLEI